MTETITLSTLDIHFADFIVRIDRNSGDELWWAAALASHSAGLGHSCCILRDALDDASPRLAYSPLRPPPTDAGRWVEFLQRCDTVGAPGAYTPLVLDPAGRLYLHRCWHYEQQVATAILTRSRSLTTDDENRLDAALDRYFPVKPGVVDLQRSAARMALTHRFSVISGGPGTGKTATVARILALLLDMAGDSPQEIALTAPTGKAALRLHQSLQHSAGHLGLSDEVRNRLPGVSTIHRLLGVQSRGGGFRHTRDNRLSCTILVVDEASMVDLQLMASLLEALRDDARVILLGDRNQLASVEAGAVLADICDGAHAATVPVAQLNKSYRFGDDSGIAALSRLINSGESAAAMELVQSGCYPDLVWRPLPAAAAFETSFFAAARDGYAGYVKAASPEAALAELGSFRVLSPLRSGRCGIEHLNRLCLNALAQERKNNAPGIRPMPVMITGNNYELGLFNGDTGVVMDSGDTQTVWFEDHEGGLRHLSTLRLPPFETALALTVHKSQGSEFDRVLLILPDQMAEVLSRELLYTAVTRARRSIEIWGTEEVFRQTIARRTLRKSGLREKLATGERRV